MEDVFSVGWHTIVPWALVATGSALLLIGGRIELDGIPPYATRPRS